jgi:hypothetical protein
MGHYLGRVVNRTWWGLAVGVFALVVIPTPATAAGRRGSEKKQAEERAARKACLTGDYAKGVSILSDLFIDTHNPTYVFNQGRCFEQNRRYEDAIARFDEYLHLPDANLSPEDRAAAETRIANCKDKLPPDHATSTPTAPQTIVEPSVVTRPDPAPPTEPTPAQSVVVKHNTKSSDGSGLRVTGIVLGSVGVVALAGGILLNLKANSMVNDWKKMVSYTDSQSNTQRTYKTLSYVGYGVGAACLATGAILFGIGLRGHSDANDIALLPNVGPDHAGAVLAGGF